MIVAVGVLVGLGTGVPVGEGRGGAVGSRVRVTVGVGAAAVPAQPLKRIAPDNNRTTSARERVDEAGLFMLWIQEWFNSQIRRSPSRVSQGAWIWMTGVSLAIRPANPPVAMAFISGPSSLRKRSTMPSVMAT